MAKGKSSEQARDFFRSLKRDPIKPAYLIFGEETFMLDLALRELLKAILPAGLNDFNHDVFYAREVDVAKVVSACEMLALFGGQRLVLLKDIQWMSTASLKPLNDYLANPSPSTTLVCYGVTTTRALTKTTGFYKKIRKVGVVQEFKALREWEVGRFLTRQAKTRKMALEPKAQDALIKAVGTDLASLDMALEKIDLYFGPLSSDEGSSRTITEEMLGEVVAVTRSHEIFELTEAIAQQDLGRSLELLGAMLEQGQNGVGINLMVARQMRQIWLVQAALRRRLDKKETAKAAGMSPFFVERYRAYAKRFSASQLRRAMMLALETDRRLKSSRLSDRVLLEKMVIAVCLTDEGGEINSP